MTDKTGATDSQELLNLIKKCQRTVESALDIGEGNASELKVSQASPKSGSDTTQQDQLTAIREYATSSFLENQKRFVESRANFIRWRDERVKMRR